jgi:hypothetical protein
VASLLDMSEFADLTAGWEMSVTMQLRTPLKWLRRHREFHAGAERPEEALPMEHACWVPVPKTWRERGIDMDEVPETTMASQIGQIAVDGGDFLPFLMEYRMIVEDGGGTLADLANRYPQYRDVLFPPPMPRKRRAKKPVTPRLSISILDYAEIPGSKDQYHFNFEFHCGDCGGYLISTPDTENEPVRCTACGITFDTLAKINDACRTIALDELKARKPGAFRET